MVKMRDSGAGVSSGTIVGIEVRSGSGGGQVEQGVFATLTGILVSAREHAVKRSTRIMRIKPDR
jgi:hypothetical protein